MSEQKILVNLPLQLAKELSPSEHPLMLKDKWDGREDLGLRVSQHTCHHTIYFDQTRLKQHLERNQKLKAESQARGYVRQLQGIERDEFVLMNLIKTLEGGNE